MVILEMSCCAIKQKPMGYGNGKFAFAYGNAQECYFSKGEYSPQEEQVAGSPEYAFNEYYSTHRLPGRIYPYYLLAKPYSEWGKEEKMQEMADIVLTKEPKVQSAAVREMRAEMRTLINK